MNQFRLLQALHFYNPARALRDRRLLSRRLRFYSQFIKRGKLCFDIGANIGNRTGVFLKLGAKVVAVEPQPSCLKILKRKFGSNSNIMICANAIGNTIASQKMYLCNADTLSSLSQPWIQSVKKTRRFSTDYNWVNEIDVKVTTLDELISQYGLPSFCKIDVEGYELEVLRGLSKAIETLSFEFTYPETIDQTIACIDELNKVGEYKYNIVEEESFRFNYSTWKSATEIRQTIRSYGLRSLFGDIYAMNEALPC